MQIQQKTSSTHHEQTGLLAIHEALGDGIGSQDLVSEGQTKKDHSEESILFEFPLTVSTLASSTITETFLVDTLTVDILKLFALHSLILRNKKNV